MKRLPVSAFIIICNEERNIEACLESIAWASEIIVVDTGSTDKSIEIASKFTDKIYSEPWRGFGWNKNKALSLTNLEWVFSIDADERVDSALFDEIEHAITSDKFDGYYIPRLPYFLGKPIRHSGWYPGHVIRLFKRSKGKFSEDTIHERVIIEGRTGYLKSDLLHYTYQTVSEYINRLNTYTSLSADQLISSGKKARIIDIALRPPTLFLKMLILRKGFLDGRNGFILATFSSFYPLLKYSKAFFKQRDERIRDKELNKKILVIKSRGLGDAILSIPFLEYLSKYFEDSSIDLLVPESAESFFSRFGFIRSIITHKSGKPFSFRNLGTIRKKGYDLIINLHSSTQTEWLCRLSGAKTKVVHNHNGLRRGIIDIPFASERYQAHIRDLLVLKAMNIPYEEILPRLSLSSEEKEMGKRYTLEHNLPMKAVWIAPSSNISTRGWGIDNFIGVADLIKKDGYEVIFNINGSTPVEDKAMIDKIPKEYKIVYKPHSVYPSILSTSLCYIGNVSGPSHVAAALDVPTIILIGPCSIDEWHPYLPPRHIAISKEIGCRGEGCGKLDCKKPLCLENISIDEVYRAFIKLMKEVNPIGDFSN